MAYIDSFLTDESKDYPSFPFLGVWEVEIFGSDAVDDTCQYVHVQVEHQNLSHPPPEEKE